MAAPRPTPGSIKDMGFWNEVFPKAMKRLNEEPEPQAGYQPEWGIRHLSVWHDVQAKLDMAQREYDFHRGSQNVGRFRRKLRDVLDRVTLPLQQGVALIPNLDMTSPVIGVVNVLSDAYRQTAEVRETVNSEFDDLPDSFATMSFYFEAYPDDESIVVASVDLVFAIFKAIEEAVKFYTSIQAKRAGLAVLTGVQYQRILLQSLTEIKACSDALESQASMSFTHRMISDSNEARKSHLVIMEDNRTTHQALGAILQGEQLRRDQMASIEDLLNKVFDLLRDMEKNWPPMSVPPRLTAPGLGGPMYWAIPDVRSRLLIPNIDEQDL
ncbi:hypothetical protein QQX98_001032 [Neonectria punicea]|uniref:Uncharacterized protein n=1 Tax=Neonectria punicea TaxID=979145 RepID=A0ABR1HRW8_9HYPO